LIVSIERGKVVLELNGKKQLLLIRDREGSGPDGRVSPSSTEFPGTKTAPFVMKTSRTAFTKDRRKAIPTAVPHRRVSFKQDSDDVEDVELGAHEEPEEPLLEEDLEIE